MRNPWICAICLALTTSAQAAKTISADNTSVHAGVTVVTQDIQGVVVDEEGVPLPGVTIFVEGKQNATITRVDGSFSIRLSKEVGQKLTFNFIGYRTVTLEASAQMKVVMKRDVYALGEVIVTTQKRTQSHIDVPAAVSALSGQGLAALDVNQFDQLSEYIPGLQMQLQSPNNPGYVIRGVTSDGGESYSQPRVSIFQDGVSISRSRASVVELFDEERVEVVKGPQGTLFGRGAEIGAVHIIRNKPTNNLAGDFEIGYGNYNQFNAKGMVNTPIVDEKLSNRFAFSYDRHDGYIDNKAGGDLNGKNSLALRNSTRLWANDKTTYDLVVDYQYDDYPGTSFKSDKIAPLGGDTSPYSDAELEAGKGLYIRRHVGGALLNVDHEINDYWNMRSITGFRAFNSKETFDADGTRLTLLQCIEEEKGTQFSQEFRFNFDNHKNLSGFVGASYFYENSSQKVVVSTNPQQIYPTILAQKYKDAFAAQLPMAQLPAATQAAVNGLLSAMFDFLPVNADGTINNVNGLGLRQRAEAALNAMAPQYGGMLTLETALPAYIQDPTMLAALIGQIDSLDQIPVTKNYSESGTNYGTNQAVEVFADLTYEIIKHLKITAGIRGTYELQKTQYKSTTVPHPLFMNSPLMFSPTDGGAKVSMQDDYYSCVGRLVLNYEFKHNNVYVSVSRGRRPAVLAFNNSPENTSRLDPEIIWSYEAGIKGGLLKNRLQYDFCTYYYDWSNFQSSSLVDDPNGGISKITVATDAGKARTIGAEASLRYAFSRYVSAFGNYSYIDGKFNHFDDDGNVQAYSGNRFRLTPKNTYSLGMDIKIPTSQWGHVYIRPSYSYKSGVFFENNNRADLHQDGYGLLNGTIGYRYQPSNKYFEVSLWGKNLTDKEYLIDAGNSGDNIGFPTFIAGAPRTFGVKLKIGF